MVMEASAAWIVLAVVARLVYWLATWWLDRSGGRDTAATSDVPDPGTEVIIRHPEGVAVRVELTSRHGVNG